MTLLDADLKPDPVLGEDTWELFEATGESFGVNLGDYHALCGANLRELADKIKTRASYPVNDVCRCGMAFYRLRRAFSEVLVVRFRRGVAGDQSSSRPQHLLN